MKPISVGDQTVRASDRVSGHCQRHPGCRALINRQDAKSAKFAKGIFVVRADRRKAISCALQGVGNKLEVGLECAGRTPFERAKTNKLLASGVRTSS